jgi:type I restriction enzyme S subunit
MSLRTGAQQPHINKGIVDDSYIVIPPGDVLKNYYEIVEPIFGKINITAMESKKLEQLRDWLLPMLMNGQVTVNN